MTPVIVAAVVLLVLVLVSQCLWRRRPTARRRELTLAAEQAGLALSPDVLPVVSRRPSRPAPPSPAAS